MKITSAAIDCQTRSYEDMGTPVVNGNLLLQQTSTTSPSSSSSSPPTSSLSSSSSVKTAPMMMANSNNNKSNYNNGTTTTTTTTMMTSSGEIGDDSEENRTNLIVNYLPQTMSQDEIRSLFATVGEIDSCKLIRDKATGQSLGYGFVNYKCPETARKAIEALNGLRLQTKTIKVSLARPSSETIKGANLYVSGLARTMTQSDVDRLFQGYGRIVTSRLLCDVQSGLSKGVGFVRYETRQEAEQAIKHLNGTVPPGTTDPVTVKFANCPNAAAKANSSGVLHGIPPTAAAAAAASSYLTAAAAAQTRRYLPGVGHHPTAPAQFRYNPLDGAPLTLPGSGHVTGSLLNGGVGAGGGCCGWCIFVYNLAPETEENVLWQLFGPFGAVQNVRVMRDLSTLKCKGFGFVTMTNYEDALTAVAALNGYQLGSRVLQVSFKKTKMVAAMGQAAPGLVTSNL